jgi:hypothetical protein
VFHSIIYIRHFNVGTLYRLLKLGWFQMRIVISPERIGYQDLPLKKEQHHYEHNPLGHALLEACEVH